MEERMTRTVSLAMAAAFGVVAALAGCSQPSVASCSQPSECPVGSICVEGLCQACASGRDACSGVCRDPASYLSDLDNCGACGVACLVTQGCVVGACLDHLLMVTGGVPPANVADVQSYLSATASFASVDTFDASAPAAATPTVAELTPYAAVLTFTDAGVGLGYADATALGDNLASYFEAGGRVVVAAFASASIPLAGRFASDYMLITATGQSQPSSVLGAIAEPASPLLAGVATLAATSAYGSTGAVKNGGVVVASWSDGRPLVVRGTFGNRQRADLNFYPPSAAVVGRADFWTGNGAELLRNALLFE